MLEQLFIALIDEQFFDILNKNKMYASCSSYKQTHTPKGQFHK